jgi:hypothetical protein
MWRKEEERGGNREGRRLEEASGVRGPQDPAKHSRVRGKQLL